MCLLDWGWLGNKLMSWYFMLGIFHRSMSKCVTFCGYFRLWWSSKKGISTPNSVRLGAWFCKSPAICCACGWVRKHIRIIRIIRTIVVVIIINNKWMSWLISMNTYLIIGWFIMSLYPHHHNGDCLGHQDWKESWSIHFTSFFNRRASVEVTQIQPT